MWISNAHDATQVNRRPLAGTFSILSFLQGHAPQGMSLSWCWAVLGNEVIFFSVNVASLILEVREYPKTTYYVAPADKSASNRDGVIFQ